MLECERCHLCVGSGMFRLVMTAVWMFGARVQPPDEYKVLCGECGLGGGALSDKRVYPKKGPQLGSRREDGLGAMPRVERVELVKAVNL